MTVLLYFLMICFICSIFFIHGKNNPVYAGVSKSEKELTILFTHDVHSHLQGLARAKTIIDGVRDGGSDPLILDGGDFSMGTLFQSVFTTDAVELRALGRLGYDAVTIGNHEFDYGMSALAEMLKTATASNEKLPIVTLSNVNWEKTKGDGKESLKSALKTLGPHNKKNYVIIEKNNVKIAVFGLMGSTASGYSGRQGIAFDDYITTAKKTVADIKKNEDADLILCLSHSGTNKDSSTSEDYTLAKKVPEIDVIISGHSHSLLREPIVVGDTIIGSIGSNARRLGKIDIKITELSGRKKVELVDYQAMKLDSYVAADSDFYEFLKQNKGAVQDSYLSRYGYTFDQVIANNPYRFTPYVSSDSEFEEYPLGNIVVDAYIHAVKEAEGSEYEKIDVAFMPSHSIRASFHRDNVTVSDIYNVCSLGRGPDKISGYPLVSGYVTGAELRSLAEMDASIASYMPSIQIMMSGMTYTYNPNRIPMDRVIDIKLHPAPGIYTEIEDEKLYRVVTSIHSTVLLKLIKEKTFGLISVKPKEKDGTVIKDFNDHILYNENGELKEWLALASYLESFKKVNGIPTIPAYYKNVKGREVVSDQKDFISILEHPNRFTIFLGSLFLFAGTGVILLAGFGGRKIYKTSKKRNGKGSGKKGKKEKKEKERK